MKLRLFLSVVAGVLISCSVALTFTSCKTPANHGENPMKRASLSGAPETIWDDKAPITTEATVAPVVTEAKPTLRELFDRADKAMKEFKDAVITAPTEEIEELYEDLHGRPLPDSPLYDDNESGEF